MRRGWNLQSERKATGRTALAPGSHSCPTSESGVFGSCPPLRGSVSWAGTGLLPSSCATPGASESGGFISSQSQTLTQPAPNPFSHLERGMFFSLTSSFSAPLPSPPERPPSLSFLSMSLQLHNIPRQLEGRRQ